MRLLLDTHIVLWWLADDPKLPAATRNLIADTKSVVMVSSATVWEVAIKAALGKLSIPDSWISTLREDGFEQLSITWPHAERVRRLEPLHKDPFDRLLVAQAIEERLTLVTNDSIIPTYNVECIVAR